MTIDLTNKSVLIVDDMSVVRSIIAKMLNSLGIRKIDFAAEGEESLRRMAGRPYDIVLCDYNLGEGRDGMQILEEAKQRQLIGLSTVFVMITGESSISMVLGAMEYRPDDYLVKPITRQMLQERLPRLIARKENFIDIEQLMREGNLEQALKIAENQLKKQPTYAIELLQIQSDLLIRLGQFEAASKVIEAAASVRENFWIKLGRGQIFYYLADYQSAIDTFNALIEENNMYTEVYDWLARTHKAMGNFQAAKDTLVAAAKISSRSIRRAQLLGEVSLRTNDNELAEQALRNAVRLGRYSVYNDPNDAARLSRVLLERGNQKDAGRILKEARKQYQGDDRATLSLTISEASNCHRLNLSDVAVRLIEEALAIYQEVRNTLPSDLAIELAKLCHAYDRDIQAVGIISHVVLYNIEDSTIMDRAREVFVSLGMEKTGARFINDLWMKVAAVNSEGVRLMQEGKLKEARDLLEKAANQMPFNPTVNITAARALLMIMEKNDINLELLELSKKYLDTVPASRSMTDDKYMRLRSLWTNFSNQFNAKNAK